MRLRVEVERDEDGRWIAEVPELVPLRMVRHPRGLKPGSKPWLCVVADRLEHGQAGPEPLDITFKAE